MSSTGGDAPPHTSIITVEGVSKRFHVRANKQGEIKERFAAWRPFGGRRNAAGATVPGARQEFWALKDISFTVEPGQTLGIVGHNGSGKSTMLKLLTGILAPTRGTVKVRGRVGALIEVGAGFHPDLSGRENIYLNGSILGLTRREIAARFDRIVDFAGLAGFIDTPVKRYSSGMYMRLGFAIAAHTDPDILLIDEVLAVGDTLFQRKCLRHLQEFVQGGGAVVFVSHSMSQVAELCRTCVWLDHGEVRFVGETDAAIEHYMAVVTERENAELMRTHPDEWAALEAERQEAEAEAEAERREGEEAERREAERRAAREAEHAADPTRARLLGVTVRDARGIAKTRFRAGEPVRVEVSYRFGRPLPDPVLGIDFFRDDGLHMFTTSNYDHKVSLRGLPPEGTVALDVDALNLNEGTYRIQANLFGQSATPDWWQHPEDEMAEAVRFEVSAGPFANGCVYLPVRWDLGDGAAATGEGTATARTVGAVKATW